MKTLNRGNVLRSRRNVVTDRSRHARQRLERSYTQARKTLAHKESWPERRRSMKLARKRGKLAWRLWLREHASKRRG